MIKLLSYETTTSDDQYPEVAKAIFELASLLIESKSER